MKLTTEEREALYCADDSCGCLGVGDRMVAAVERIIADRLQPERSTFYCVCGFIARGVTGFGGVEHETLSCCSHGERCRPSKHH